MTSNLPRKALFKASFPIETRSGRSFQRHLREKFLFPFSSSMEGDFPIDSEVADGVGPKCLHLTCSSHIHQYLTDQASCAVARFRSTLDYSANVPVVTKNVIVDAYFATAAVACPENCTRSDEACLTHAAKAETRIQT